MSEIAQQLSEIFDKTTRLIDRCAALQEENSLLRLENKNLKDLLKASKTKHAELEEMVRVLKLAQSLAGFETEESGFGEKTLDIRQKISNFVSEIEKCIVLLKK